MASSTPVPASFVELLARAVSEPGILSRAYFAFHGYSLGNRLLALVQCELRGIEPGPIDTFIGWKSKGRFVQKGQKAIVLCMPITVKRRGSDVETTDATIEPTSSTFTKFIYRPNWFVASQTEGQAIEAAQMPAWSSDRALAALEITEVPFTMMDGNCQGYALNRTIAVSPVAALPYKTRFHELAHVVLGHTSEGRLSDTEITSRNLREVEAEAVAMMCLDALNLPGVEYARGYIQHWNQSGEAIPERSAQKIFKAADAILRAGRPDASSELRAA